ncbi:MAG: 1-acyl-sn-glycerol-3-phosphate acyltransferase [Anaerolineales bacterium]|nr:1-acyl-sn-glycerol-3-phosphate acyltransferase [Anaerolineales bacterium]MCB8951440.1 1-acyl-sn-glycerol-3-phosphate acyltransferase [Ardenticatenales bacterium]
MTHNPIRAIFRIATTSLALALGTFIILLTGWIPVRVRRIRFAAWNMRWMARAFLRIFDVRLEPPPPETFTEHEGFIFPNHLSYVDIVLLVSIMPMRFLAKESVRTWPFIGWMARAVGTVFVNRGDKASRHQAREQLAHVERYPPIVVFPEGRIGPGGVLLPFRHGAFEIAAQNSTPFLPCAIIYDREALVQWGDETLWAAVWRLAGRSGPVQARLMPLPVVHPTPEANTQQLALQTHEAIARALAYPPGVLPPEVAEGRNYFDHG